MTDTTAATGRAAPALLPRQESDWVKPLDLPTPFYDLFKEPTEYDPGEELVAAVNVALLLGQPLLLTGEPGCGKTSLAFWLAQQLGLEGPLVQVVKSTTSGRDLHHSCLGIAIVIIVRAATVVGPAAIVTAAAVIGPAL